VEKKRSALPEKRVDRQCVDDRVESAKIENKGTLGTFPLLDIIPAEPVAKEYSVGWMVNARTDFLW